jgi:hypothetical protein
MMMMFAGLMLLNVASALHGWYAGHAAVPRMERARVVSDHGGAILLVVLGLLAGGVVLIGASTGLAAALFSVGAYFFILPLFVMPLLRSLHLLPSPDDIRAGEIEAEADAGMERLERLAERPRRR